MNQPTPALRPRRRITGMSAILLPFHDTGAVDWAAFDAHVVRTSEAGLTPAVNMDTGYVQLLDDATATQVLDRTAALTGGHFVAGAYVADEQGARHDEVALLRAAWRNQQPWRHAGGVPVPRPGGAQRSGMGCCTRHCRPRGRAGSSGSSWAPCSCPTDASCPSTPIGR